MARARHVSFIDKPLEAERRLRATRGGDFEDYREVVATLPARSVDPRQTRPWNVTFGLTNFSADQDFPEEVLYEITKHIVDSRDRLIEFHPQCAFLAPQTMAMYTWPSEYHPGARRFYESVGVRPTYLGDFIAQLNR